MVGQKQKTWICHCKQSNAFTQENCGRCGRHWSKVSKATTKASDSSAEPKEAKSSKSSWPSLQLPRVPNSTPSVQQPQPNVQQPFVQNPSFQGPCPNVQYQQHPFLQPTVLQHPPMQADTVGPASSCPQPFPQHAVMPTIQESISQLLHTGPMPSHPDSCSQTAVQSTSAPALLKQLQDVCAQNRYVIPQPVEQALLEQLSAKSMQSRLHAEANRLGKVERRISAMQKTIQQSIAGWHQYVEDVKIKLLQDHQACMQVVRSAEQELSRARQDLQHQQQVTFDLVKQMCVPVTQMDLPVEQVMSMEVDGTACPQPWTAPTSAPPTSGPAQPFPGLQPQQSHYQNAMNMPEIQMPMAAFQPQQQSAPQPWIPTAHNVALQPTSNFGFSNHNGFQGQAGTHTMNFGFGNSAHQVQPSFHPAPTAHQMQPGSYPVQPGQKQTELPPQPGSPEFPPGNFTEGHLYPQQDQVQSHSIATPPQQPVLPVSDHPESQVSAVVQPASLADLQVALNNISQQMDQARTLYGKARTELEQQQAQAIFEQASQAYQHVVQQVESEVGASDTDKENHSQLNQMISAVHEARQLQSDCRAYFTQWKQDQVQQMQSFRQSEAAPLQPADIAVPQTPVRATRKEGPAASISVSSSPISPEVAAITKATKVQEGSVHDQDGLGNIPTGSVPQVAAPSLQSLE